MSERVSRQAWHMHDWCLTYGRMLLDVRTDNMWHLYEWLLTCGRMLHDKWRMTFDVCTNDACYVDDWCLTSGWVLLDMWRNDIWYADERYKICGRIITLLRLHFWHGRSPEPLLYLVHIFDMDILMNHYLTSFTFLTWTISWVITLPCLHFWHGHSHESLVYYWQLTFDMYPSVISWEDD